MAAFYPRKSDRLLEYVNKSMRITRDIRTRHCETRSGVAIYEAVWIATPRSSRNVGIGQSHEAVVGWG
jgi:hypothetical protein